MTLSALRQLTNIFNDIERRVASQRQMSYL